ncbi:hypothetical protein HY631_00800 [Candidatus Uhrbacteria bacterium]|nr:hypothetical protein [Candidatus Uhrbacteria bacterium]
MEHIDWIFHLKHDIPKFLERLKGHHTPGFFHYSLSGDLIDEQEHWGLGNTVFAIKSYFTLGQLDTLPERTRTDMVDFVKSFQSTNGSFFDPIVYRRSFWRDKLSAFKHHDFNNAFHQQTKRAETRQALSALGLLGEQLGQAPADTPKTEQEIDRYLARLDWTKPWGAGSHFSHLLFFLAHSQREEAPSLITHAVRWIATLQRSSDGGWYAGSPSLQQKINGAMKVITGLKAADRLSIHEPRRLIDMALGVSNDAQACDHFNVIYVLKYADEAVEHSYRHDEITSFAVNRLAQYRSHYWPEQGGFSYFLGKANNIYYNAAVSRGLPEPDIHGTVLFLWGIALIAQILGREAELGFKEFIT